MTSCASSLHAFLKKNNKRPSKKLSQNFLIDSNIVHKLLDEAQIKADDVVLEIGPGTGAITQQLIHRGARVIGIEKDYHLALALSEMLNSDQCTIIQGDILDIDLPSFLPKNQKIKVISNLPFQITSLIFDKLLPMYHFIETLTLILQKDVLHRLLAQPKSKTFSSLTLFTEFYASIRHCFDVSASCYYPKPAVETAVVQLTLKEVKYPHIQKVLQMIRRTFGQRRKMLSSTLPLPSQKVQDALRALSLDPLARPEDLNLDNWGRLYEALEADLRM